MLHKRKRNLRRHHIPNLLGRALFPQLMLQRYALQAGNLAGCHGSCAVRVDFRATVCGDAGCETVAAVLPGCWWGDGFGFGEVVAVPVGGDVGDGLVGGYVGEEAVERGSCGVGGLGEGGERLAWTVGSLHQWKPLGA